MLWYNSNSQCAGGRTGTELDRQAGMPRLASGPFYSTYKPLFFWIHKNTGITEVL